nr:acylneuraminate cytidylyltransferase family protein [Bacteroidota bacterium]
MKKTIALIPARGGSKKIHKKNIKLLHGIPLIAHTIKVALSHPGIERVIVSTDDREIVEISREYGAEVPFLRPTSIAQDNTPDKPVVLHALDWLAGHEKYHPELVLFLRPTTPFKTTGIIDDCLEKSANNPDLSSVRTVTKATGIHHPYWMFKDINNVLKPFIPEVDLIKYYQRQLLPTCYQLNGVVDILRPEIVKSNENMYGNNIGFVEIDPNHSVDIDDELDFAFAEFLMERKLK